MDRLAKPGGRHHNPNKPIRSGRYALPPVGRSNGGWDAPDRDLQFCLRTAGRAEAAHRLRRDILNHILHDLRLRGGRVIEICVGETLP